MSTAHSLAGRQAQLARRLLVAGAGLWCASILAAPLFGFDSVYAFFSAICHQNPDRSWHLGQDTFAACIRCTSIYLGSLIALTVRIPANSRFLKTALAAAVVEFLCARAGLDYEITRSVTGLLLGLSAAGFVEAGVAELIRSRIGWFQERTSSP